MGLSQSIVVYKIKVQTFEKDKKSFEVIKEK